MIVRDLENLDFRSLAIYVTTCRLHSLTACATEMGLPKSTVSKAIAKLEHQMDAKLLIRSTRTLQVTESGKILFERAEQLLEEMQSIRDGIQNMEHQVQGTLRIAAAPAMAGYLTENILSDFMETWPKVRMDLKISYDFEDLFAEGIDLAIRAGRIDDDRLVAHEIGSCTRIFVASPAYLEKNGRPETPDDLVNHRCVRYLQHMGHKPWYLHSKDRSVEVDVDCHFTCVNHEAVKMAAVSGIGIAQMPVNNMVSELKQKQLVRILPEWHATPMSVYMVYRPGVNRPKRLDALIDHILARKARFQLGPDDTICQSICGDVNFSDCWILK